MLKTYKAIGVLRSMQIGTCHVSGSVGDVWVWGDTHAAQSRILYVWGRSAGSSVLAKAICERVWSRWRRHAEADPKSKHATVATPISADES